MSGLGSKDNATIWLVMVIAVAIHVVDEALTGFLDFYNPAVARLRARLGFFPAPTFTFEIWITGLIVAIIAGLAFARVVARGGRRTRVVCGVLSFLMVGSACGHMLGSLYLGRVLPVFWSSPLLLATSAWMLARTAGASWSGASAGAPPTVARDLWG